MMTGDHARAAEAIAAEVGIDHVLSEVRPDEKAAAIERLRAQGKTVCMVGDGINDTPALAVADCTVAMGGGPDIAIESAGILLPSGNLEKLPELFDISRATVRTIRQNLTWALFYNLVSIPIAALGVLHPSICATAMSASSIGVLMHSLRLKDSDKRRDVSHGRKSPDDVCPRHLLPPVSGVDRGRSAAHARRARCGGIVLARGADRAL